MDQPLLRLLIQEKLADGRLPSTPIPRARGGPGIGQTCDGCGETVTTAQTVMGNPDAAECGLQFHVACFHVWDVERQASGREPGAPSSGPIRVRSSRRPSEPAMGAQRPARPSDTRHVTLVGSDDDAVKALVIDDESLIRDIYAEFLALLGHEADLVVDVHEGLARFDPLVHQVVITDFLMPGLTGLEIAEAIRARGTRRRS